jgi:hypothetical protein
MIPSIANLRFVAERPGNCKVPDISEDARELSPANGIEQIRPGHPEKSFGYRQRPTMDLVGAAQ